MDKRRLSGATGLAVIVGTMLVIIAVLWALAYWGAGAG